MSKEQIRIFLRLWELSNKGFIGITPNWFKEKARQWSEQ